MIDNKLDELTKDVLAHSDIVGVISSYLNLTKKGRNYWAICPFHDDSNPSLSVSPEKRRWKCWVCGVGGTEISFVQKYNKSGYMDALRKVAEINGFSDPRLSTFVRTKPIDERKTALLKCLSDLTLYYQYALNTAEGKEGLDYLEKRNLNEDFRTKYKLGYAYKDGKATCDFLRSKGHSVKTMEDVGIAVLSGGNYIDKNQGRIIFPICDTEGNVIGYSARRIRDNDGGEKYVNSPETYLFHKSNILYNFHIAKEKAKLAGYIYVCEGFMDVFALAKVGIDNAVAIMGTNLTAEHIAMLRNLRVEIRLCLDGDAAGQNAMMKISKVLAENGLSVRVVNNQNNPRDPDEILNQDGPEELKTYLNNLIGRIDFALNYYRDTNPLKTTEQKRKLVQNFIPILLGIEDQLELDSYLIRLAGVTGFAVEAIRDLLNKSRGAKKSDDPMEAFKNFHPEKKALRKLEFAEREMLFQMLNCPKAIAFYESKLGTFYDDLYRQVANYVVDYAKVNNEPTMDDILASIEMADIENKEAMVKEITDISYEESHNKKCTDELLDNLLASINGEKKRIFEKDILQQSLEGKDPIEKARIMKEYNARKWKNNK